MGFPWGSQEQTEAALAMPGSRGPRLVILGGLDAGALMAAPSPFFQPGPGHSVASPAPGQAVAHPGLSGPEWLWP